MVSLLIFRPRSSGSEVWFHRTVCDGEEMGFRLLRNNRAPWHMIYAHIEAYLWPGS